MYVSQPTIVIIGRWSSMSIVRMAECMFGRRFVDMFILPINVVVVCAIRVGLVITGRNPLVRNVSKGCGMFLSVFM